MNLEQGTIIKVNFNPQLGHEQAGYRPAIVISNTFFNQRSNLIMIAPITNTIRNYPTRINLNHFNIQTTGQIMCEQLRTVDLKARKFRIMEKAPKQVIQKTLDIIALLISEDQ